MHAVIGASGYLGSRLVARLAGEGKRVHALARDRRRVRPTSGVETFAADLLRPSDLQAALDGCETAYYLVHSMEPASTGAGGFGDRDRRAAEAFAGAASAVGVERIVYLGGLAPGGDAPSAHLASRLEVERILLDAVPLSTALRASIVVGAGSSSFRILVRLVERLPTLPVGAWSERRTRPIDERDVLDYLALAPEMPATAGRSLDVAGPDELSYGEIVQRVAELMGVGRGALAVASLGLGVTAPVVAAVTEQPLELVRPLMESLEHDLLPRDDEAQRLFGLRPRPFDRAVERALRDWERFEELGAR